MVFRKMSKFRVVCEYEFLYNKVHKGNAMLYRYEDWEVIMNTTISTLDKLQGNTQAAEMIFLSCRLVFRIDNHGKAMRIQGVKGTIYVTLPEDLEDYILTPGEQLTVRQRGLVLVQGFPDGAFQYMDV